MRGRAQSRSFVPFFRNGVIRHSACQVHKQHWLTFQISTTHVKCILALDEWEFYPLGARSEDMLLTCNHKTAPPTRHFHTLVCLVVLLILQSQDLNQIYSDRRSSRSGLQDRSVKGRQTRQDNAAKMPLQPGGRDRMSACFAQEERVNKR